MSGVANASPPPVYQWMDCFRFVAAALVAISHIRDIMLADYPGELLYAPFYILTGFGHSGVIVFFVLSGFWISRSVLTRVVSQMFWGGFLIDRLSRLELVVVPALILGGVLDWLGMFWLHLPVYFGASGAHSIPTDLAQRFGPEVFLGNLVFLQTIAVPAWGSNGPLWSLANEFWYYLWFPALVLLVGRRKPGWGLLAFGVALFDPGLLSGFAAWLVGFALLILLKRKSGELRHVALTLFAATAALVATLLLTSTLAIAGSDQLLAVVFGGFLYALAQSGAHFPGWLEPLANYGSRASFSLYAIHFPLAMFLGGWLARAGRLAPSPSALALVLSVALVCIAAGWLFAMLTERHTDRLRDLLKRRLSGAV